jgi:hypothetical protein
VLPSEHLEAAFIAYEMKRLRAQMGGLFGWGDFVILRELPLVRIEAHERLPISEIQRALESHRRRVAGGGYTASCAGWAQVL